MINLYFPSGREEVFFQMTTKTTHPLIESKIEDLEVKVTVHTVEIIALQGRLKDSAEKSFRLGVALIISAITLVLAIIGSSWSLGVRLGSLTSEFAASSESNRQIVRFLEDRVNRNEERIYSFTTQNETSSTFPQEQQEDQTSQ